MTPATVAALLLGLLLASAPASSQPSGARLPTGCMPSAADIGWAESALRHWRIVEREALQLPPAPLPTVIVADARCIAAGTESGGRIAWEGTLHQGQLSLPDGQEVPLGPVSFAAPNGRGGAFFVMSLPSVWQAHGVTSGLPLERLMDGVLLHEMAHTRQFATVSPLLERLTRQYGLPPDIGDDSLQQAFSKDADYVKHYEAERDLLFAAAAAPSAAEARALAAQALARMRERRDRWFSGANEKWRHVDDVFLTMEGLGQWVAWWWFTQPQGLQLDRARAMQELRRGGRFWTQDAGLALFLVIDRLLPGWQGRPLGPPADLAEALLAAAVASR